MKIIFSDHARAQIGERNIAEDLLLHTVTNPDKVVKQSRSRFAAQRLIEKNGKKYLLIIVCDEIGDICEIVTAFFTTKFKKYL